MNLIDYIAGRRRGREARRIEREAMEDIFLRDALDGFDAVEGDHVARIDRMRRRVAGAPKRLSVRVYRVAAAAVLLCATLDGYWMMRRQAAFTEEKFAENESAAPNVKGIASDSVRLAMGNVHDFAEDGYRKEAKSGNPGNERPASSPVAERKSSGMAVGRGEESGKRKMERNGIADDGMVVAEAVMADEAEQEAVEVEHVERYASSAVAMKAEVAVSSSEERKVLDSECEEGEKVAERNGEQSGNRVRRQAVARASECAVVREDTMRDMSSAGMKKDRWGMAVHGAKTSAENGSFVKQTDMDGPAAELLCADGEGADLPRPRKGEAHFVRYVEKNRRYPSGEETARGGVVLRFEVGTDGCPRRIKVVRGLNPTADAEAVRLLREGPAWTAGSAPAELVIRFR